ncbi:MAG: PqqD family protein [Vicinamibacterales bacterium]
MSAPYIRSPDASASPVGERVVLYHRVSRTAVVLNPTGGWMWSRLDAPRTADDLIRDLRSKYPSLSEADAARDVAAFLTELAEHKMVSVGP